MNERFGNSEQLAQPDAAGGLNEQSGNSGQLQGEQSARELLAAEVDLDAVLMPEREGAKEVADSIRDGGDGNIPFVSTALRAIVAALAARLPVGQEPRTDLVPGVVRCAKCAFQMYRTNLYVTTGILGPGDSKTEPCPNGCGPLWPITWETWAREGWAVAERLHMEKKDAPPAPTAVPVALQDIIGSMLNYAGVADTCEVTQGHAPVAIRNWAEMLQQLPAPAAVPVDTFQDGVSRWMGECFLPSLYSNMTERGDRLLEEVLELLQSNGYDPARVQTLVQYVYGRPVGDPAQEVGGVMVTLAGYCWIAGLNMHDEGARELARITQPEVMAKIRRKQEAKNALHFDTPLPGHATHPQPAAAKDGA